MPDPSSSPVQSPPPAEQPPVHDPPPGPAERLRELAREFLRTRDRRLLYEYLRLRNAH
ncbi:MAG: hypothetical protein ABSH20_23015 [Tepidisphaeraceae bacterium]|jgi:hypothetical protein